MLRYLGVLALLVLVAGPGRGAAQTPTVEPVPTVCAVNGLCGSPVVVVGYSEGAQGVEYVMVTALLFGFTMLVLLAFVDMYIGRRQ